jgi:hypothetical protein
MDVITFPEWRKHTDAGRLLASVHFSLAGARFLELGGYIEDAGRNLLNVCDSITTYLWLSLAVDRIRDWLAESSYEEPPLPETKGLLTETWYSSSVADSYWRDLVDLALYALRKADRLFRRSRRAEEVFPSAECEETAEAEGNSCASDYFYLIGDKIPTSALTLACSLGLVTFHRLEQARDSESAAWLARCKHDLAELIDSWSENRADAAWNISEFDTWLQKRLEDRIIRHSYPMIDRLHAIKVLVDNKAFAPGRGGSARTLLKQVKELRTLRASLDAGMHFTPLHSGVTGALVYLRFHSDWTTTPDCRSRWEPSPDAQNGKNANPIELEKTRRSAQRDLDTSREMYTMQRSFYESISGLYYLYDDFSDRQVHFNHALQMAGAEVVTLLTTLLKLPDRIRRTSSDPPAGTPA